MAPRKNNQPEDDSKQYEMDRILGHDVDLTKAPPTVSFRVGWMYYPDAMADMVNFDDVKGNADDVLKSYLVDNRVEELPETEEALAHLLADSAMIVIPDKDDTVTVREIIGHKDGKRKGTFLFTTVWSNDEQVDRPKRLFKGDSEKALLAAYLADHPEVMRTYNKRAKSLAGTATRPNAVRAHDDVGSPMGRKQKAPAQKEKKAIGKMAKNAGLKRPIGRPRKNAGDAQPSALSIRSFFNNTKGDDLVVVEKQNGEIEVKKLDDVFTEKPELILEALKKQVYNK